MLKKRKAQGLPITTIILVIIGLIVLVVLVAIFTGRIGGFGTTLSKVGGDANKDCKDIDKSYELRTVEDCTTAGGLTLVSKDVVAGKVCCTK